MRTGLDTNVLSALWASEPLVAQIKLAMVRARQEGGLVICGLVYVELSAHPLALNNFLDRFLAETNIAVDFVLDEQILREAARGFSAYSKRRRESSGGQPKSFLADFAIGAHALLKADRLFTLDRKRYVRDFPNLRLFPH